MVNFRLYTEATCNSEPDENELIYKLLDYVSLSRIPNAFYRIALIERLSDNSYIVANGLNFHEGAAIDWDYGHYFASGRLTSAKSKYLHCISKYDCK